MALLTLADAKVQLNLDTDTSDIELQSYVDSVTSVIERFVGPVEDRPVTEVIEGRSPVLCLTHIPVVVLTAVAPVLTGGEAIDLADLVTDGPRGIVRRRTGGTFAGGLWSVQYTAGRGEVPPTINLAARILLQHLWLTQQGMARGGGGSDDYSVTEPIPGFGYAVPNRVLQLLEPYKLPSGVA